MNDTGPSAPGAGARAEARSILVRVGGGSRVRPPISATNRGGGPASREASMAASQRAAVADTDAGRLARAISRRGTARRRGRGPQRQVVLVEVGDHLGRSRGRRRRRACARSTSPGGGHDPLLGDAGAELGGDLALGHDDDAVGDREALADLGGGVDDGEAAPGAFGEEAEDLGLGADVDAARGLVEEEDRGVGRQHLADDDLLLVAAGERADQRAAARGLDGDVPDRRSISVLLAPASR